MEEGNNKKPSVWSRMTAKKMSLPLTFLFVLLAGVIGAVVEYHSINADLTFGEGRSSADTDFARNLLSGETRTHNVTITNAADVPLKSVLDFVEVSNVDGVTYSTNTPLTVTTPALSSETYTVFVTGAEDTVAGLVKGKITYTPLASA